MTNAPHLPTPSASSEADGVGALPHPSEASPSAPPVPAQQAVPAVLASVELPQTRRARKQAETKPSRAGRDLPMAIGVGVTLLALIMVGLFLYPPLFVALGSVAAVIGVWEVSRALQSHSGVPVPLLPLRWARRRCRWPPRWPAPTAWAWPRLPPLCW